ncbi:hypothetical protein PR048_033636 [Dryococelus australis]|uniref:Uncharacterized protein n=1 Tax=Dryococelus australis TaxID=614101 RepID=A0ABQ9G3V6_9NEOP|nr:hypothetical protein PR048_033636 [Dryococelus australis]
MRVNEVRMEQAGETGDPENNRHDSHMRGRGLNPDRRGARRAGLRRDASPRTNTLTLCRRDTMQASSANSIIIDCARGAGSEQPLTRTGPYCVPCSAPELLLSSPSPRILMLMECSGDIWTAVPLNIEVLRADEGEASSAGIHGWMKREVPEKTRLPAASSATIPTCENPRASPPEIEPGSPCWKASRLTNTPPRSQKVNGLNVSSTARSLETVQVAQGIGIGEGLGRNRAIALVRSLSQHSPGVISGNHGKPKSGWSNPGPPECESSVLPLCDVEFLHPSVPVHCEETAIRQLPECITAVDTFVILVGQQDSSLSRYWPAGSQWSSEFTVLQRIGQPWPVIGAITTSLSVLIAKLILEETMRNRHRHLKNPVDRIEFKIVTYINQKECVVTCSSLGEMKKLVERGQLSSDLVFLASPHIPLRQRDLLHSSVCHPACLLVAKTVGEWDASQGKTYTP